MELVLIYSMTPIVNNISQITHVQSILHVIQPTQIYHLEAGAMWYIKIMERVVVRVHNQVVL